MPATPKVAAPEPVRAWDQSTRTGSEAGPDYRVTVGTITSTRRSHVRFRRLLLYVVVVLALAAAACGNSDDDEPESGGTSTTQGGTDTSGSDGEKVSASPACPA